MAGFNLITGDNGSGKTTLLEALHLLAHGRSFRARVRDGLVRQGDPALQAYVEWRLPDQSTHRAGLRHTGSQWQARLDGSDLRQISQLCEALAVISFEPGSHALLMAAARDAAAIWIGACFTWNIPFCRSGAAIHGR